MFTGTIFVAGIYGVGKSTVCQQLGSMLHLPMYSAGDLISKINGEEYGTNKAVKNKDANQNILSEQVGILLNEQNAIILAGHFCIFNKYYEVEYLPERVFKNIRLNKVILLEADVKTILFNLQARDKKEYSENELLVLQEAEHNQAQRITDMLSLPLFTYSMCFDNCDADRLCEMISYGKVV